MDHTFGPLPLVGIEHPYTINNLEKGIKSLGGTQQMSKVCRRFS